MDPLNVATADAVRRAIRRAGETQSAVSARAGIPPTNWKRRMSAEVAFLVPELLRIAQILETDLDELTSDAMELAAEDRATA